MTVSLEEKHETKQSRHGLGDAPVALFATLLPISGSILVMVLGPLLAPWLRQHGTTAAVCVLVTFTLLGAVAITPTYTTSIVAGWTFGFAMGFPLVLCATVGGGTLCYWTSRRLASQRVAAAYHDHPKWEIVRSALLEGSFAKSVAIVLLLRLSPVLPFGTTNVLLATGGVRLPVYLLGTVLGLIPRLSVVTFAAAKAEQLDLRGADSLWMLAAGFVATGVCIVTMAIIGKRALDRVTRQTVPV